MLILKKRFGVSNGQAGVSGVLHRRDSRANVRIFSH